MRGFLLIACIIITNTLCGQIVYYGCDWKYFDLAMAPPNQSGVTWKQAAYNDVSWTSGPAELGYGDGDEATVISSATLTAYYRYTFNVDDPADFSNLLLQLTYDDGAVVYLNGDEIWRVNMPNGTLLITHSLLPTAAIMHKLHSPSPIHLLPDPISSLLKCISDQPPAQT
jgi:hypothetical protein